MNVTVPAPGDIAAAALWLSTTHEDVSPAIPKLRGRFGLSAKDACEAIRQADTIRNRRNA